MAQQVASYVVRPSILRGSPRWLRPPLSILFKQSRGCGADKPALLDVSAAIRFDGSLKGAVTRGKVWLADNVGRVRAASSVSSSTEISRNRKEVDGIQLTDAHIFE